MNPYLKICSLSVYNTVMADSIFSKIIKGEIPCYKIYEDENSLAFLDIHPKTPGHALVVPKKQVEFIWDLDETDYQALMTTVQKVGKRLRSIIEAPYVGQIVMGTDVPHAHVHVFPFFSAEEFDRRPDMHAEPDHDSLAALASKLAF
jgi:histidine triad (HIT) family protein